VTLAVSSERVPGGWLVDVAGEVDLHTAPQLRAALDEATRDDTAEAPPGVVVDLTGVGFIDSTGLGEIVGAHKALSRRDGQLHLAVTSPRVQRLLTLTGLDELLPVHASRDEALAAIAPPR
jgi:anti-sigma B factor antagonist